MFDALFDFRAEKKNSTDSLFLNPFTTSENISNNNDRSSIPTSSVLPSWPQSSSSSINPLQTPQIKKQISENSPSGDARETIMDVPSEFTPSVSLLVHPNNPLIPNSENEANRIRNGSGDNSDRIINLIKNIQTVDEHETNIFGKLTAMCSLEEMLDKQRTSTTNDFERLGGRSSDEVIRVVNKFLAVKSFQRSDASKVFKEDDVRPVVWCRRTIHNVLNMVVEADIQKPPWLIEDLVPSFINIFGFLRDRIRALWQDLTVQHAPTHRGTIETLEISFRFLILAEELLCENSEFDAVQNGGLMSTCLDKLMNSYESSRSMRKDERIKKKTFDLITKKIGTLSSQEEVQNIYDILVYESPYESEFWAYRMVASLSLGGSNTRATDLCLQMSEYCRNSMHVSIARLAIEAYRECNIRRYVKISAKAPLLLRIFLDKFKGLLRLTFLKGISGGAVKCTEKLPWAVFMKTFGFAEDLENQHAQDFCRNFGLHYSEKNQNISGSAPSTPSLRRFSLMNVESLETLDNLFSQNENSKIINWNSVYVTWDTVAPDAIELNPKKIRQKRYKNILLASILTSDILGSRVYLLDPSLSSEKQPTLFPDSNKSKTFRFGDSNLFAPMSSSPVSDTPICASLFPTTSIFKPTSFFPSSSSSPLPSLSFPIASDRLPSPFANLSERKLQPAQLPSSVDLDNTGRIFKTSRQSTAQPFEIQPSDFRLPHFGAESQYEDVMSQKSSPDTPDQAVIQTSPQPTFSAMEIPKQVPFVLSSSSGPSLFRSFNLLPPSPTSESVRSILGVPYEQSEPSDSQIASLKSLIPATEILQFPSAASLPVDELPITNSGADSSPTAGEISLRGESVEDKLPEEEQYVSSIFGTENLSQSDRLKHKRRQSIIFTSTNISYSDESNQEENSNLFLVEERKESPSVDKYLTSPSSSSGLCYGPCGERIFDNNDEIKNKLICKRRSLKRSRLSRMAIRVFPKKESPFTIPKKIVCLKKDDFIHSPIFTSTPSAEMISEEDASAVPVEYSEQQKKISDVSSIEHKDVQNIIQPQQQLLGSEDEEFLPKISAVGKRSPQLSAESFSMITSKVMSLSM